MEITKRIGNKYGLIASYKIGNSCKENGKKAVAIREEKSTENITVFKARIPFPSLTNFWPGRTDRTEESSGMPKNIEGTNEITQYAPNNEIIKIESIFSSKPIEAINEIIVLECNPGIKPQKIPRIIPKTRYLNTILK